MKTILVVDDNAICREPIAAMLRLKGYQTFEAANGQEALEVARTQKPDLILLDVAMPVMDGLSCVGELRTRPVTAKIPVIMLTGASERQIVLEAAKKGIAGFLLKSNFSMAELITRVQSLIGAPQSEVTKPPATLETVREQQTISASASAEPISGENQPPAPADAKQPHTLTKSEVLQRLAQEIELRSIKPVLEYVIALTRSSTSNLEDIASAIRQDQALALQVLRVANSSFYRRGRSARDLVEATQRIGITAVRNAVIAILSIEHFEHVTESGLVPQRFWEHSLTTGVLAEMVGEAVSSHQTDHLFLAGLLHDVGRMVLSTMYPTEYAAVVARSAEHNLELSSVEQEVFGISHADVTRHLLEQWNMPSSIVEAASLHESPINKLRHAKQGDQGILTVALANRMAHALVSGSSGNARLLSYHEFVSELGLDNTSLHTIAAAALQKTTDTQMFYAAQSNQHFCNSLAVELTKQVKVKPRIVVLAQDSPADPFSLFFEQFGWLEPERPVTALLFAQSHVDFTRYLPSLKQFDAVAQEAVAVIVATAGQMIPVPAEWSFGRHMETVLLPCNYSHLLEVVIRCSTPFKSGLATVSAR